MPLMLSLLVGASAYVPQPAAVRSDGTAAASQRCAAAPVALLGRLPVVRDLADHGEFEKQRVSSMHDDALMIVKYYQPRCRSCAAIGRKLDILQRRRPQHRIFEVNVKSPGGKAIMAHVGKPEGVPTISIYDKGEVVFSKPVPLRLFNEVMEVVNRKDKKEVAEGEEGLEDEESGRPADLVYGMMSNLRRSRKGE